MLWLSVCSFFMSIYTLTVIDSTHSHVGYIFTFVSTMLSYASLSTLIAAGGALRTTKASSYRHRPRPSVHTRLDEERLGGAVSVCVCVCVVQEAVGRTENADGRVLVCTQKRGRGRWCVCV